MIAALDMPFVAIPGGSEGAMIAEIKSAVASQKPYGHVLGTTLDLLGNRDEVG